MSAELQILVINCVLLAYAYLWAYPALTEKKLSVIMTRDMAISAAALLIAGALFYGSGVRFSLIIFETNWLVFSILTLFILETPLFFWFAKKHNLDFNDFD
ncbi:MAG: hypothetical protein AAFP98_12085 [Pseudomonadota bacterium]